MVGSADGNRDGAPVGKFEGFAEGIMVGRTENEGFGEIEGAGDSVGFGLRVRYGGFFPFLLSLVFFLDFIPPFPPFPPLPFPLEEPPSPSVISIVGKGVRLVGRRVLLAALMIFSVGVTVLGDTIGPGVGVGLGDCR
jgi:hypothetical protein